MFGSIGWGEVMVLLVVGLFVFGPERLPGLIRDAGKMLRELRKMAQGMQQELKDELGPDVGDLDLRSLHPRVFVEKHLFGPDDDDADGVSADRALPPLANGQGFERVPLEKATGAASSGPAPYDADAT